MLGRSIHAGTRRIRLHHPATYRLIYCAYMKFLILYTAPVAALEEWMAKPEEERKASEEELKDEWNAWMAEHAAAISDTAGLGKNKSVTSNGVEDAKNGLMLYSIVEGDTHEAVAELFRNHPHLKIPGAAIEIMPTMPLS